MFNELNTIEHYIIKILSGVNLNSGSINDNQYFKKWTYKSSDTIKRELKDVLVETSLKEALINLNPKKANVSEKAE